MTAEINIRIGENAQKWQKTDFANIDQAKGTSQVGYLLGFWLRINESELGQIWIKSLVDL